jgi:hypothetical protein
MSTTDKSLLDRLVADARPVRRLWPVPARLAVWLALVAGLWGSVAAILGWPVDAHPHRWSLSAELLIVLTALVAWAGLALRSAVPDRAPPSRWIAAAMVLSLCPMLFWTNGAGPAAFIAKGVPCALRTAALALLPCLALLWAVRRGAALAPRRAAALSGGAGFLVGYLLVRVLCSVDEPAHLLAWHAAPVALGVALAAAAGGWWVAGWRTRLD